jgi:putative transferase (TIGR04331 family)
MRANISFDSESKNEFERLFSILVGEDVPQSFIEGYGHFQGAAGASHGRKKAVVSAISWAWDETFKFWAAAQAEQGALLAGVQHGGNYGIEYTHPIEEHEIAITDRYFSWGWDDASKPKITPLPASKYIGVRPIGADNAKEGVLLATVCFSRFLFRFQEFRNYDHQTYFHWQQRFMTSLTPEHRYRTRVRLFIRDHGWGCRERWHDLDPKIILEDWRTSFHASMRDCRLHVSDHLSSTFLDALVADKPTILFWDPVLFRVRGAARPYLDELREAGILYDAPEAAAAAVERVYGDVEGWWGEEKRQATVRRFCTRFARTAPDSIDQWADEMNRLSRGRPT